MTMYVSGDLQFEFEFRCIEAHGGYLRLDAIQRTSHNGQLGLP